MKTVQVREAKAGLSALVAAAENGEPTTITRHGHAAAMLVPVEMGRRLYPENRPSFAAFLLGSPEPIETSRDETPLAPAEFE